MATTERIDTRSLALLRKPRQPLPLPGFLLCCIGGFELLYVLLVALSPFPGLHLSSTPLGEQWSWTFFPAHLLATLLSPLIDMSSAHEWLSPVLLGVTLSGLMGIYALAGVRVHRHYKAEPATRFWLFLLLGATLLFGLTLLFQPMLLSDDVFTYIFSGRILAVYGADPLNTAPIQFPYDPYLKWVISGRASPNIYGPFWLCIASLLATISNKPVITLLLFKGMALLAHLLNCILVWNILARCAPRRLLLGTLLYAWNPLIVIELAGSGHNEGVLLTLLLLGTLLYIRSLRQSSPAESTQASAQTTLSARLLPWLLKGAMLLVFGLALSTNLVALLIVPLLLWFDVRTAPQAWTGMVWRALIVLVPALAVSLPFWRGGSTFLAITSAIDMQHFVYSPISLLVNPLRALFGFVAALLGFPLFEQPSLAADVTLRASAVFIFALIYLHLFTLVWRAPTTRQEARMRPHTDRDMTIPGFDTLLSSWGIAVFWYMVLVSGWFWPWYLLWLLWIVILQRPGVFSSAMLVLSGTALFIYPFVGFSRGPVVTQQVALIFGLPLAYLIAALGKQRHAERIANNYGRRS